MIKKYECIKKYPGGPAVGTIYKEVLNNKNMFIHDYEVNKPSYPLPYFLDSEFWKLISE